VLVGEASFGPRGKNVRGYESLNHVNE